MIALALSAALLAAPQEPVASAAPSGPGSNALEASEGGVDPENLRGRIHEMRMNLLLGGDRVKAAEREAIDFYNGKAALVEGRLDSVHAELAEKRASYDLALDRALNGSESHRRQNSMAEAGRLRAKIAELEGELQGLEARRDNLGQMVSAVESRERERERLVAELETSTDLTAEFGLPMGSIGLAPALPDPEPGSPLEDPALVEDLLRRDPRRARRLLFEADPSAYWDRFPLQPPGAELRAALAFPLAGLPGRR